MKFEDVFIMLTWTVEVPRASALVKRVHIMPLKTRFKAKNICIFLLANGVVSLHDCESVIDFKIKMQATRRRVRAFVAELRRRE